MPAFVFCVERIGITEDNINKKNPLSSPNNGLFFHVFIFSTHAKKFFVSIQPPVGELMRPVFLTENEFKKEQGERPVLSFVGGLGTSLKYSF